LPDIFQGHLEHRVSQDLKELLVQVDQLEIQVTQGLWASLAVVDLQDQRARQDLLEQVGSKDLRDPKALLAVLDPVDQRVLQDLQVQLDLLELLGELDSQDPVGHPVIRDNRDFQDLRVQLVNPVHKVRPVPLDNRDQLVQPEHLVEPVPQGKVVSQGPRVLLGHRVLLVLLVPLDQRETPDPLVELEQRDLQAQLETKEQLVRKDSLVLQDSKVNIRIAMIIVSCNFLNVVGLYFFVEICVCAYVLACLIAHQRQFMHFKHLARWKVSNISPVILQNLMVTIGKQDPLIQTDLQYKFCCILYGFCTLECPVS
jgi:hypothetical protein